MELTYLPPLAFNGVSVSGNIDLSSNQISYIDIEAFHVSVGNQLYVHLFESSSTQFCSACLIVGTLLLFPILSSRNLQSNGMTVIKGQMFVTGSYVDELYFKDNQLRAVPTNTFLGLSANIV